MVLPSVDETRPAPADLPMTSCRRVRKSEKRHIAILARSMTRSPTGHVTSLSIAGSSRIISSLTLREWGERSFPGRSCSARNYTVWPPAPDSSSITVATTYPSRLEVSSSRRRLDPAKPDRFRRMDVCSSERVEHFFGWPSIARFTIDFYLDLVQA